ncbi:MAG: InlB B-repeat-containing protein [Lachnospiraceae bacterium]|nr:InlB B-repeat-containing protein [Lachnospiraceae bacterium]
MKAKKLTTRVLGTIMSVLMLMGTIPDTGLAAMAADDDTTTPETTAEGSETTHDWILSALNMSDIPADESADDTANDTDGYKIWVGDVRVTDDNKDNILGDGTAKFDPASNTLTLNNAVINKASTSENGASSSGNNIFSEQSLTIKGSATLTSGETGISCMSFKANTYLVIEADLTINASKTGIMTFGPDLTINNSKIDFTGASNSIGIMGYSAVVTINGGNIKIDGSPMMGLYALKEIHLSDCSVDAVGSEAAVLIDYADGIVDMASPLVITEPEGGLFQTFQMDNGRGKMVDCTGITDAAGNVAKSAKLGPASGKDVFLVSFDMQGHGYPVTAQNVVSGKTVAKPVDPKADDCAFEGWFTEKECTNEYNFDTPVSKSFTLYAKWNDGKEPTDPTDPTDPTEPTEPTEPEALPDPIYGSGSPLDPLPTIIPGETMDLYLVKGQKFNIGEGWSVDKAGSKVISINKKGVFKAKKAGEAVITAGSGDNTCSVNVHVAAPKFAEKSAKLEIKSAENIAYTGLNLSSLDKEHYDILWYSASPDVATVDPDGKVTAVSQGKAKVTAYVNGNAYTCTVSVKEQTTAANRTFHIALGDSKKLSIKGIKKPVWTASTEGIVSFKGKKKVTGAAAGFTTLTTTAGDNTYTVETYVEDLKLSDSENRLTSDKANKYKLSLNNGDSTIILLDSSVDQSVVFKSNKADVAFVDEEGCVIARSKGKCKITTKIDGKTITINVEVK